MSRRPAGLDTFGPGGIPALVHFTPLEAAVPLTRAIASTAAGVLADALVVD